MDYFLITEAHADRLQNIASKLGTKTNLPESKLSELQLLAKFHDIGKVGIPESILFKPSCLTPEKTCEIQRHCEIGHHIAFASPDLAPIADWFYKTSRLVESH